MRKIRLENWSLIVLGSPYIPPECKSKHLHGEVYDHPSFKDGDEINTSQIVSADSEFIETLSGSFYELGCVNPDYESEFPNSRQRLLDAYL